MDNVQAELFVGDDDDNVILAGDGADVLEGRNGDDTLIGGLDKDTLRGGEGDDVIIGGGVNSGVLDIETGLSEELATNAENPAQQHPAFLAELLVGGAGNDDIIGGSWTDEDGDRFVDVTIFGNEIFLSETDLTTSPGYNNIIWGGDGDDLVVGQNGFDTLGGGAGNDRIFGFDGPDLIYGGAGDDAIFAGDGASQTITLENGSSLTLVQTIFGGDGNDNISTSGNASNVIFGGAGNDRIDAGLGDDRIRGGSGDDVIGFQGADTVTGGEGADQFQFLSDNDDAYVITDFDTEEDTLQFFLFQEQSQVDDFINDAEERIIDGVSGLLINVSNIQTLFLVGVTNDDIGNINALGAPPPAET